ncbi:hypothetical protein V8G54_012623 [Vigna mungo]|uniref:Uncharacterized protein n=1 Tax=Vigna mungo TaxID=3915 RepID=A0AAQ3NU22_VIGMU
MVQGLGEALMLFPRSSGVMTKEEYYNGSRHCILIASGDPVPRRMLVSLPQIDKGRIFGTQLHTLNVDFCEVAEMFGPGNNGSPMVTTPNSNIRIGELNVLLARNFKEAHDALRGKRRVDPATKESVKSMRMTNEEVANMVDPMGGLPADDSMFIQSRGNIVNTEASLSRPVLPYACTSTSSSRRPHLPFLAAGFDPYGRPVFGPTTGVPSPPKTPQFNPHDFWPPPPSCTYSQNLVQAWEGTLFGKIQRNHTNTQRGKVC